MQFISIGKPLKIGSVFYAYDVVGSKLKKFNYLKFMTRQLICNSNNVVFLVKKNVGGSG